MSELIISASKLIHNISHMLSGTYKPSSPEYNAMKKEVFDIRIQTPEDDKTNSRSDIANIGNDLKKALKEYGENATAK